MKRVYFVLVFLCGTINLKAQVYKINQFFLTQNSTAKPVNARLEIKDNMLIYTAYELSDSSNDSVVTTEKIIKQKGSYYKTQIAGGACNYEIYLSPDKKEQKAGIYIVDVLIALNNGERRSYFLKGCKLD